MAIGGAARVLILGAAGRDFHNFNVVYRDDPTVTVVAFNRAEVDVVVSATPLNLTALVGLNKPVVRARYEFADAGRPTLGALVDRFLARGEGRRAV